MHLYCTPLLYALCLLFLPIACSPLWLILMTPPDLILLILGLFLMTPPVLNAPYTVRVTVTSNGYTKSTSDWSTGVISFVSRNRGMVIRWQSTYEYSNVWSESWLKNCLVWTLSSVPRTESRVPPFVNFKKRQDSSYRTLDPYVRVSQTPTKQQRRPQQLVRVLQPLLLAKCNK